MRDLPKVSIITTTYNDAKNLQRIMEEVAGQDYKIKGILVKCLLKLSDGVGLHAEFHAKPNLDPVPVQFLAPPDFSHVRVTVAV